MKKVIFTLLLMGGTFMGFSQATYYWVGGATGNFGTRTSWNTALDGSGSSRTALNTDVLIFDGTNIGGATPGTGQVTPTITGSATIGQLKLQNAADLVLSRSNTATSGTSTYIIAGDGTAADDLTQDATSKLRLTSPAPVAANVFGFILQLGVLNTPASGTLSGTTTIADGGNATNRILAPNTASLNFLIGSFFYCKLTLASAYPFGSSSNSPAAATNGVTFKAGSTAVYQGGNSIFANTSTFNPIVFETGSTLVFESANASGMFGNRTYANVIVRPSPSAPTTPVVVAMDGNHYNIDTLTIDPFGTFNIRATGTAPISGNIVNNGTFGVVSPTTSNLVLAGIVPQTVGGSGTFTSLGAISVGTAANVTLQKSINLTGTATSSITGRLNVQSNVISATGNFQFRGASTATYTATTNAGANDVTTSTSTAVVLGALVTGPGIQPNSFIISTSGTNYTLSKPATATAVGVTLTTTGNPATFETANAGGADASITSAGTRTFSATTNYIFNSATTTPFSDASNASASTNSNNVTFNAAATTNRLMTINGALTLGGTTGKLTIRPVDTLRISPTGSITGTFSSTRYIATDVSGASVGVLRVDSFTTAKNFPVGTPNYYMPVTLTPQTVSTFCVSLFQGVTAEGTANGTPFNATQKSGVVDAVWTINRTTANVDNCTVTVNWDAALEGAAFPTYGNSIGISRNDGTGWTTVGGSGDNTLNTATNTFSAFSPFGVGQLNTILPIRLYNFSAKAEQGKIKLQWNVNDEGATGSYSIERSSNGTSFTSIGTVIANGAAVYSTVDANPYAATSYYRIKVISKTGAFEYSSIIKVKLNDSKPGLSIFPNPVQNKTLNLQMDNFAAGKVQLKLYNNNGQLILNDVIQYNGGSQVLQVQLPSTATKGAYRLVVDANNETIKQTVIVQ